MNIFQLFPEDKINSQHQEQKADQMVPPKRFVSENQDGKYGKNNQRDHFLKDF